MAKTVLVVDDKKEMVTLVQSYLAQEGYRVVTAANGREALFVARQAKPALIILDLMMPEMGGYDFMQVYRKEAATPVIMLTAKLDENDKVLGLELGADDYVTKPFSLRELTARVRAVLRRAEKEAAPKEVLQVAEVILDREYRAVSVAGKSVNLTPSEFDLLAALMAAPGRPFSRLELLEHLGDVVYEGYERTIDVHIRNLRAKIEPDSKHPRYVITVYGVGYRFAT